ncbi:MAG: hypothetical protein NTW19_06315 [Planctomycetota bacterium]|nr:hypothetical protein [Planctomycetota bacterium]
MRLRRYRHLFGRFGRTRRWRRRILLVVLILFISLVSTFFYLTRPHRLAAISASMLADAIGTPVYCTDAHLGLDGSIHLRQLRVAAPPDKNPQDTLFTVDEVLVRHDVWSLLFGKFRARSLVFINPTLHLTEDTSTDQFSYQRLERRTTKPPNELPEVRVRGGRVIFGQVENGEYHELGVVRLGGSLAAKPGDPHGYHFQLQQELAGGETGPTLSGDFDLDKLAISARLDRFSFDAPQRVILPARFRKWWDDLDPAGSLPIVSFAYSRDLGLHAVLDLRDAELTLPYGALKPRLGGVSGRFNLTNQKITIENLRGSVEGLTMLVDGDIHGYDKDAPFTLSARIEPFDVPAKPPSLPNLPDFIKNIYARYSPSGTVKATVRVERKEPAGKLSYSGTAFLSNGSCRYFRFPYPVHDLKGEIRFNDEKLEIASMTCKGPTGGKLSITGVISPPGDGAMVHAVITAIDFPVDEHLRNAMAPKQAAALRLFADPDQHKRLVGLNLIQTTELATQRRLQVEQLEQQRRRLEATRPAEPVALAAVVKQIAEAKKLTNIPVFDLGGRINLTVDLSRPLGEETKYTTVVDVQVTGGQAVMSAWPYPLGLARGKLRIEPNMVTIDGVEVRGPTGAVASVNGQVGFDEETGLTPNVKVLGVNVPVDPFLLAAIAPPQDRWLAQFGIQGKFDISGGVVRGKTGGIDFAFRTQTVNASARPMGGRFDLEKMAATIDIRRGQFDIVDAQAMHGKSKLHVTGSTRFEGDKPAFDMTVDATEINLKDPLLDLLPSEGDPAEKARADQVRKMFATYDLRGEVDGSLRYGTNPGKPSNFVIDVRPRWLGVNLGQGPVDLKDIKGKMLVDDRGLRLQGWSASVGEARIGADGELRFQAQGDKPRGGELTIDLEDRQTHGEALKLFPPGVEKAIKGIELEGAYQLRGGKLVYHPDATAGNVTDFKGKVHLSNGKADITAAITELEADLDVAAFVPAPYSPKNDWPRLDLKILAPQLRLAQRRVESLAVRLLSGESKNELKIVQLNGSMYGGTLTGEGVVGVGAGQPFRMTLNLADVALDPLIHPMASTPATAPAPGSGNDSATRPAATRPTSTGNVAANLSIEGVNGDVGQRRGRGKVEVREAKLYELPMALAMLQILNLSLPTSRSFDTALAEYRIEGDIIRVDTLRFESPNLQIGGDGAIRLSDRRLSLDLTSRNRGGIKLGPITDVIDLLKDEIVSIHVGGTLMDPQVQVRSLKGLRRSGEDVFKNPRDQGSSATPRSPGSPNRPAQTPLVGAPATSDQ